MIVGEEAFTSKRSESTELDYTTHVAALVEFPGTQQGRLFITDSEQLSQSLLDTFFPSAVVVDLDGIILKVNLAWRKFGQDNGLSLNEAGVGLSYFEGFENPQLPDVHSVTGGIRDVLSGAAPEYVQLYPCHSPGQERWFELRVRRFPEYPFALIVHEDVTQREQDARMIREQAEFMGNLLAHTPESLQLLSLDGEVLWTNASGERLMQTSGLEGVLGRVWATFWPPEAGNAVELALSLAASGREGRFQANALPSGSAPRFWDVLVVPVRDSTGQPARLLATARDMTELHTAQNEALKSHAEAAQLLSRMQEGFFTLDRQWRFTFLNPQAEILVRRSASETLGHTLWAAFPGTVGSLFDQHYRRAVTLQRPERFEAFFSELGIWFDVHAYPHGDGLAVYFQDVTAWKLDQQAQHDRNAILEMVVGGRALPGILEEVALMVERQLSGSVCVIKVDQGSLLYATPGLPSALREALARLGSSPEAGMDTGLRKESLAGVSGLPPEHVTSEPGHDLLVASGLRQLTSVPIIDGMNVILGQVALYTATALPPLFHDMPAILARAGHLAAVAIEHDVLTRRLTYQARYDALTGLANRNLFEERLRAALLAATSSRPTSLLFIDVDNFKSVNDTLGHEAGDEVVREVARRLVGCFARTTTVARISGDEFTVILTHTPEAVAVREAQQVTGVFAAPFLVAGREIHLSASVGVSVATNGEDAQTLLRHADLAMYRAKSQKTGHAVFRAELNRRAHERFELAGFIRRAVEDQEFTLDYQPIVALQSGTLVGVEALLRWHHPQLGMVSPAQFIPVAEDTGLIVPIGLWVLREACEQAARWVRAGHNGFRLAVNVSPLQFAEPDFVSLVRRRLDDTELPAHLLTLELTERTVMRNVDDATRQMKLLRNLGVSIAMDDFGKGYSSLSYLARLPIDILKIDRSFVTGLSPTSATLPLVHAMVNVADSLGLTTIAEGIETPQELEVLQTLGCVLGQGFLFSPPCSANQISARLVAQQQGP